MISVEDAVAQILADTAPLAPSRVDLLSAAGAVAAAEQRARYDLPPFDNSAMDGYAVRAEDGATPRRVVGTIACGDLPGAFSVKPGEAARIMTGAPLPPGADAVIMQEEATRDGDLVSFSSPAAPGQHVRRRGADVEAGEVILPPGTPLSAAAIAALASQGRSFVLVHRRPQVAILSTGSELVEIDEAPRPGELINSNAYALAALVREAGGEPVVLGVARDDRAETEALLARARFADLLLTSGGVSVGEFDYVKESLDALGYTQRFWKVAMKPGKPVVYGLLGPMPVLGLPGNPASCQVSFCLFARPLIRRLLGDPHPVPPPLAVTLDSPLRGGERRHFARALVRVRPDGTLSAQPMRKQGSSDLRSMLGANALLDVAPHASLAPGALARAHLIGPLGA